MIDEQRLETPGSLRMGLRNIFYRRVMSSHYFRNTLMGLSLFLSTACIGLGVAWILNLFHLLSGKVADSFLALIVILLFYVPLVPLLILLVALAVAILVVRRIAAPLAIRAYLRAVRREEDRYRGLYTPLSGLKNIYATPIKYSHADPAVYSEKKDLMELVEQQDTHLLILGLPGAGKTIALRVYQFIALEKYKQDKIIPIFVPMKGYNAFLKQINAPASSGVGPQGTLLDYLLYESSLFKSELKGIHHLGPYFERLAEQGRFLFLCDGLNELGNPYLEPVCAGLLALMKENQHRLVLTCRELDYREQGCVRRLVDEGYAAEALIPPLQFDQIREFVTRYVELEDGDHQGEKWNFSVEDIMRIIGHSRLRDQCTNPLMLYTLMRTINGTSIEQGIHLDTRGLLLRAFVLQLIERELEKPRWSGKDLDFDEDEVVMFLSELAWTARRVNSRNDIQLGSSRPITGGGIRRTPTLHELANDLINWLVEPETGSEEPLPMYEEVGLRRLHEPYNRQDRSKIVQLLEFARNAELIALSPQGLLSFRHEVIAEYFVAEYIYRLDEHNRSSIPFGQEFLVDGRSWRGPVAIWAGLVNEPMDLAQRLTELEQASLEDVENALVLSLACVGVSWTHPQAQQQKEIVLPTGVEERLAYFLPNKKKRKKLADILNQCAEEGGVEVYRSLIPLLEKQMEGIEDLLVLLDPLLVSGLLFEYFCDIAGKSLYIHQVASVVSVLGQFGNVVVLRATELSQSAPKRNVSLRAAAIDILGRTRSQQAVEPLCVYLNDPEPDILNAVGTALVRLGPELVLDRLVKELEDHTSDQIDWRILKILQSILEHPKRIVQPVQHQRIVQVMLSLLSSKYARYVQQQAKSILLRQAIPSTNMQDRRWEKVIQLLIEGLFYTDMDSSLNVVQALKQIGNNATQLLLAQLKQSSPDIVHQRIVEILGSVRDLHALQDILSLVGVSAPTIQREVDIALRNYAPESISYLIEMVLSHTSQHVAYKAARILQDIGEMAVGPMSQKLLPIVPGRTQMLVEVLVHMHDMQAVPSLIAVLSASQGDADLSVNVIRALSRFSTKQVVAPVLAVLANADPPIYKEASQALARLGWVAVDDLVATLDVVQETRTTPGVRDALLDMNPFPEKQLLYVFTNGSEAQVQQIMTVFQLKKSAAAFFLVCHLFHAHPRVRNYVRQTLHKMELQDIMDPLLKALDKPDWRTVIAEYLLKSPESVPRLVKLLGDSARSQGAFYTLLDFGPGILPALVMGLDDPNRMVQKNTQDIIVRWVGRDRYILSDVVSLFALLGGPQERPRAREALLYLLTHDLGKVCVPALLDGLENSRLKDDSAEALVRLVRKHDEQSGNVMEALLAALRREERRGGAASALVKLDAEAVNHVGNLIVDPDSPVALIAQRILSAIGVPAFGFIWAAYRDKNNRTRQEAAQKIFRDMPTDAIKDKLVELLISEDRYEIEMAQSLLSERTHDEYLLPHTEQKMIPALLDRLQAYSGERTNLRILAFLLLQHGSTVIEHMIDALYKPNHQEWLIQAFLLLGIEGPEAKEALIRVLHDSRTSPKLFAEVVSVLGMMDQNVGRYASTIGKYGLYANHTTRVSQIGQQHFAELEIAQRALGALLASGKWNIHKLDELRHLSEDGSAEHELYSVLLGARYGPEISHLEDKLVAQQDAYEQEKSALKTKISEKEHVIQNLSEEVRDLRSSVSVQTTRLNETRQRRTELETENERLRERVSQLERKMLSQIRSR